MAFERYVKSGRIYRPFASIWLRGQIGINQGAVERFKIKDYKLAVLFYDKEIERIGIRLTNDENEEGATTITQGKTGVVISAVSFLDFYGIDHSDTRKYPIDYNENENLYVIDLKKPMQKKRATNRPND